MGILDTSCYVQADHVFAKVEIYEHCSFEKKGAPE